MKLLAVLSPLVLSLQERSRLEPSRLELRRREPARRRLAVLYKPGPHRPGARRTPAEAAPEPELGLIGPGARLGQRRVPLDYDGAAITPTGCANCINVSQLF